MTAPWFVLLISSQQEIQTVWRVHRLGLELYVPVIRKRIKTGRVRHGHAITRLVARPMFPSYGFIRTGVCDLDRILATRGIRDFLRNEAGEPAVLPHEAVMAIYDKQQEEHIEFIEAHRKRRRFVANLHLGDQVKVSDGGIYSGLVANVTHIDARGRVEVLFGLLRHNLPAEMLAAE